jgi:hypothetical protein
LGIEPEVKCFQIIRINGWDLIISRRKHYYRVPLSFQCPFRNIIFGVTALTTKVPCLLFPFLKLTALLYWLVYWTLRTTWLNLEILLVCEEVNCCEFSLDFSDLDLTGHVSVGTKFAWSGHFFNRTWMPFNGWEFTVDFLAGNK